MGYVGTCIYLQRAFLGELWSFFMSCRRRGRRDRRRHHRHRRRRRRRRQRRQRQRRWW